MGIDVIAEGVETLEEITPQRQRLFPVSGLLLQPPLTSGDFSDLLTNLHASVTGK